VRNGGAVETESKPSVMLKIHQHQGLEGQILSIPNVGPVAPLFDRVHGGLCQSGIAFNQVNAFHSSAVVHRCLEDDRALLC